MTRFHEILPAGREFAARAANTGGDWRAWPFSDYGYSGGLWPIVAKFLFLALILGGICLFLRFLFGPGGPLREKWVDEWVDPREKPDAHDTAVDEMDVATGTTAPATDQNLAPESGSRAERTREPSNERGDAASTRDGGAKGAS